MKNVRAADKKEFGLKLLEWWSENKQDFPWRKTRDPYSILVAEVLLRKTTAKQVERIYGDFLDSYPTSKALSRATEKKLSQLLNPLGMEHTRAKLFTRLADAVAKHNGKIPRSEKGLRALPGVGKYSANAVLCLAYGKDMPMVDTNAVRVVQRVFSFAFSKARAKDDPYLWDFVKNLMPAGRAMNFNLAIIDFAHKVCKPKNPHCCACPLKALCIYGKAQTC